MASENKMNGWETVSKKAATKQPAKSKPNAGANSKPSFLPEFDIPVANSSPFSLLMNREIKKEEEKSAKKRAVKAKLVKQDAVVAEGKEKKRVNDVVKNSKTKNKSGNSTVSGSTEEPPKGLENALKSLNKEKIDSLIGFTTTHFPENPIIWLKDISSYLNSRVNQDPPDLTNLSKPHDYPFCLIKKDVQEAIIGLLRKCSPRILQVFHEHCLDSITLNIKRGIPASGYRVMIQALAIGFPEIAPITYSKFKNYETTNSDDSRIVITLLWCALQPALYSLHVAIHTWVELFKPYIGHKFYGKYATESLVQIAELHSKSKEIKHSFDVADFISLMEYVYSLENIPTVPQKTARTLMTTYQKLRDLIYLKQDKTIKLFFPAFLSLIRPNISSTLKDEICYNLVRCLNTSNNSYIVWRQVYKSNLDQTYAFLEYLDKKWQQKNARISNHKVLIDTLEYFREVDAKSQLSTKRRTNQTKRENLTKRLLAKTRLPKAKSKKSSLWKTLVLSFAIFSLIFIDCQMHGSLKKSMTYKALERVHAIEYGERFWKEMFIPNYNKALKFTSPYIHTGWSHVCETANALWEKSGPVKEWSDRVVPPFLNYINEQVRPKMNEFLSESLIYGGKVYALSKDLAAIYGKKVALFLEENVFTGSLSKENIARFVQNTTDSLGNYLNEAYLHAIAKYKSLSE